MKGSKIWASFEALYETIPRTATEAVASALHRTPGLVRKWKRAPETEEEYNNTGERNPLDRIAIIISTMEKIDPERAYMPIEWLCALFNFLPPVKMPEIEGGNKDIVLALLEWSSEVGESAQKVSEALKDGEITPRELKACYKEFREDMAAGQALMARLEEKANNV